MIVRRTLLNEVSRIEQIYLVNKIHLQGKVRRTALNIFQ